MHGTTNESNPILQKLSVAILANINKKFDNRATLVTILNKTGDANIWINALASILLNTSSASSADDWSATSIADGTESTPRMQVMNFILSGIPLSYPNLVHLSIGLDCRAAVPVMVVSGPSSYVMLCML